MGALPQDRKGDNLKVLISFVEEENSEETEEQPKMSKNQIKRFHKSEKFVEEFSE